jgi:hypothetical protein
VSNENIDETLIGEINSKFKENINTRSMLKKGKRKIFHLDVQPADVYFTE